MHPVVFVSLLITLLAEPVLWGIKPRTLQVRKKAIIEQRGEKWKKEPKRKE